MNHKKEIINWINRLTNAETLFLSIHFNTPPETQTALCHRCRPIFQMLFKRLIGRHWHKTYEQYFRVLGVQEFGQFGNMHAHFILVCRAKFDAMTVLNTLIALSHRLKKDVWTDYSDKSARPKQYADDIMAEKAYSSDVIKYTTKEIKINGDRITDNLITDVDLFS